MITKRFKIYFVSLHWIKRLFMQRSNQIKFNENALSRVSDHKTLHEVIPLIQDRVFSYSFFPLDYIEAKDNKGENSNSFTDSSVLVTPCRPKTKVNGLRCKTVVREEAKQIRLLK